MSELEIVAVDPFDPASFEPWWRAYHDAEEHRPRCDGDDLAARGAARPDAGRRPPDVDGGLVRRRRRRGGQHRLDRHAAARQPRPRQPRGRHDRRAPPPRLRDRDAGPRRAGGHAPAAARSWVARPTGPTSPDRRAPAPPDGSSRGATASSWAWSTSSGGCRCPSPTTLLDELAAEAAGHHAAYTLRSWVGPVPDDLVVEYADIAASLMTEAPTGRPPPRAGVTRRRRVARGRGAAGPAGTHEVRHRRARRDRPDRGVHGHRDHRSTSPTGPTSGAPWSAGSTAATGSASR